MTLPDFLMIGAPKAGTTAMPVSPRTGGRIAKVTWTRNSTAWMFDEAKLHRATVALDKRLAALSAIAVPAVIPGGMADASFPATDQQPVQPPPDSRRSS